MAHDFKKFPELTDGQMLFYYNDSPHKQITQNFSAKCVRVIDGDTISVRVDFRDFEFPMELQQLIIKYALKEVFQVGAVCLLVLVLPVTGVVLMVCQKTL
jgi:hypothetical protein